LIRLGQIVKPRGNKGEVILDASPEFYHLDDPSGREIILKSQKYTLTRRIAACAEISGRTVLKLHTVDSVSEAWKLIGYTLWLDAPAPAVEAEAGLLGYTVVDTAGRAWGLVQTMPDDGPNPLLVVVAADGRVREVPYHDAIVITIDHSARAITIDPPPGLFDLNV
jgi:ribosomal 30S subunit maturation factor RimM